MSFFSDLASKMQQAGDDLYRGVQGKETGAATRFDVTFDDRELGMTVTDVGGITGGGEGVVSAVIPDGAAARLGIVLNDRVIMVGSSPTPTFSLAVGAIRAQPSRPLRVTIERREKSATGVGLVNFRLDEELEKAERILSLMVNSPATGPPARVLASALGLAFLRVTKVGFAFSGRFGTGLVVARLPGGGWSAPSAIGTVGVSMGLQVGAQVADYLIVLNTREAVLAFSSGGQLSLGGQIGVVAGPVGAGREGAMVAQPAAAAPVFTYSISQGLFIGVSLEGSSINERNSVNERHYGMTGVRAKQLLSGEVAPTPEARSLLEALNRLDVAPSGPAAVSSLYAGVVLDPDDKARTENPFQPAASQPNAEPSSPLSYGLPPPPPPPPPRPPQSPADANPSFVMSI